ERGRGVEPLVGALVSGQVGELVPEVVELGLDPALFPGCAAALDEAVGEGLMLDEAGTVDAYPSFEYGGQHQLQLRRDRSRGVLADDGDLVIRQPVIGEDAVEQRLDIDRADVGAHGLDRAIGLLLLPIDHRAEEPRELLARANAHGHESADVSELRLEPAGGVAAEVAHDVELEVVDRDPLHRPQLRRVAPDLREVAVRSGETALEKLLLRARRTVPPQVADAPPFRKDPREGRGHGLRRVVLGEELLPCAVAGYGRAARPDLLAELLERGGDRAMVLLDEPLDELNALRRLRRGSLVALDQDAPVAAPL